MRLWVTSYFVISLSVYAFPSLFFVVAEFDLDMPDFGDLDVNKSDGVCVTGIMDKSPSPAKMIKHPKVVELSQDRATMGLVF